MSRYTMSDLLEIVKYKEEDVVNVFKKVRISESMFEIGIYDEYIIKENDRWDRLSNRFYGTPHLWWLLATYNKFLDPFTTLVVGEKINIIKPYYIPNLLLQLKGLI